MKQYVICIDKKAALNDALTIGKEYKVVAYSICSSTISVHDDSGQLRAYPKTRFIEKQEK